MEKISFKIAKRLKIINYDVYFNAYTEGRIRFDDLVIILYLKNACLSGPQVSPYMFYLDQFDMILSNKALLSCLIYSQIDCICPRG